MRIVETFKSQRFGDVEAIEAGADQVLVHQRNSVRGRTSGVEVVLDYWIVVTFRSGKMVRDRWFENRAEALAAAGLSE